MTKDFAAKKNNRQNNQREQLSPQEWAEQKQLEKEALYQQIDSTAEEISENPDKLKSFLDLQARMDRYSSANALLIFSQLPEATRIKDFSGWGEDNVRLKKGVKFWNLLSTPRRTALRVFPTRSKRCLTFLRLTARSSLRLPSTAILIRSSR